jgi:hypothetical protein
MTRQGMDFMSTALEMTPTQAGSNTGGPKKNCRGSETRQRTARMILSLLPAEKTVAGVIARQYDKPSIQAMLIDACGPLMSNDTLEALAADRQHVQDVADKHGISEVQALLLLALTTQPTGGERLAG